MLGRLIEGLKIIHAEDPHARVYLAPTLISLLVDFPRFSPRQLERLEELGFEYDDYWGSIWMEYRETE